ncbi:MAG: 1-deoxy-D-xylulose-5-phosphate synthase [Bacillota bacterium]
MPGKILNNIHNPLDVKKLENGDLKQLSRDVRKFLIDNVSRTGGHLSSNLGVVELTISLLKTFDFSRDKIVWDVGHQAYVYKILTGRKEQFDTLRQIDGLSGFPKTSESQYDFFNTGHSSTSISAALGMARARDLLGEDFNVIAVIGDGAMTGGMAFEALNDASHSKSKMIIVLNDNEMSISKNVGGLARYLSKVRISPKYVNAVDRVKRFLAPIPWLKRGVTTIVDAIKNLIKLVILPGRFFQQLGLKYIGPVDGHNFRELTRALNKASKETGPSIVHVVTTKGKGYEHAENFPDEFHGISPFNSNTGIVEHKRTRTFSDEFGDEMVRLAREDEKIHAIVAAMQAGTGLLSFEKLYPSRLTDVGIAEQHAVTLAAGMAASGLKPVFAVYSTFLQRAYDQIIHDVGLQNLHVVFAIDRAGLIGEDGETHQGLYDLSYLLHVPNMTILAPCDFKEFRVMLRFAVIQHDGPIAIRYPRGGGSEELFVHSKFEIGKAEIAKVGREITIITIGSSVELGIEVSNRLEMTGISAEIISCRSLKPFDEKTIVDSIKKTGRVAIIEDNCEVGGLASVVISVMANNSISAEVLRFAYPDEKIIHGKKSEVEKRYLMDSSSIFKRISAKWGDLIAKDKD